MDYRLEYIRSLYPNAKCELKYNNLFELLIAIMLSAQTTDIKVNSVTSVLFNKYKTIKELQDANIDDLEKILHPLGLSFNKAKHTKEIATIIHDTYNDVVPSDRESLLKLPGVGNKTVNVLMIEGFNIPAMPVDTHILRVSKRIGIVNSKATVIDVENKLKKLIDKNMWGPMHHSMIFFGRYTCKAISPDCKNCKLKDICKNKDKKI